jgi:DNA processing protein
VARIHWLQLRLADGLGPTLGGRLVEAAGSAAAACGASAGNLLAIDGIGKVKAKTIAASLRAAAGRAEEELARAEALGLTILSRDDGEYPAMLRPLDDAPMVLWVRGAFEPRDLNGLAVVGSRACSSYGREQAERFAAWLAGAGYTIISGGAKGVDAAAHRGALRHPAGRTIAVLGCGVDVEYPPGHARLYDEIADGRGAVVADYPPGTPPHAQHFPPRNRIVSGLSRGTLVIEAAEQSGAHITARLAADEHGRPVFALPGRVDNPMTAGPHRLIRQGATLVTAPDQIPDDLGPLPDLPDPPRDIPADLFPPDTPPDRPALVGDEATVWQALDQGPANVDTLCGRTDLPAHIVLRTLTTLSLKGRARRLDGQTYEAK